MNRTSRYQPIGFIDDRISFSTNEFTASKFLDARRLGADSLVERPDEVVLALPQATPDVLRRLCRPGLFQGLDQHAAEHAHLLSDRSAMSQIRSVAAEDLLPRAPVHLHTDPHGQYDSRSANSDYRCRRVHRFRAFRQIAAETGSPVLYERHENSLYTIAKELDDRACVVVIRFSAM